MTAYVDKLFRAESKVPTARFVGSRCGHRWAHMWADDVEELLAMADRIGLKRKWLRGNRLKHFDLVPSKRKLALQAGAMEMDLREYFRREGS